MRVAWSERLELEFSKTVLASGSTALANTRTVRQTICSTAAMNSAAGREM
jgi:hypothetical protein